MHSKLREATKQDFAVFAEIERAADRLFPQDRIRVDGETYPAESLSQAMSEGILLAAEANGSVVGFAAASPLAGDLHLYVVAVYPNSGRRGIGKSLVLRVVEEASRRRLRGVSLTTFEDLPWNGPFYRRIGFRTLSDREQHEAVRSILSSERAAGMEQRIAMFCPVAAQQDDEDRREIAG